MKKFLFTLLALFMASTAFATNEYFYMDDIQVTKSFLAQEGNRAREADIPVKAHFEARVSAWQVDLTLPEGVTFRNAKPGSDMSLHTLDAVGNDKTIAVEVNSQIAVNRIIVANTIAGYYYPEGADPDEDDPVTCGAAKWEAGEYEMMMIITLRFSQDFTGGEITVQTAPSSGQDPRGGITDGLTRTSNCQVTVVDDETFSIDPTEASAKVGETINVTATVSASDATLSYTGATVTATAAGFDITSEEAGVFNVTATATIGEEKTFGSSKWTIRNSKNYVYLPLTAEGTYTFEEEVQPKDLTGEITISDADENGKFTVTYDGEEDVTLTVKVGEDVVTADADGKYSLPDYGTYTVTATASATDYNDLDAEKELTWKKTVNMPTIEGKKREGSKKYFDIIITPDANTDGDLVYTAYPMGTVLGAKAEPVTIQYERGNEDYYVDVTAYTEGTATYNQSETAEARIKVPKLDQVATPEINYVVNGDKITITATCETDEATVTLYDPDGNAVTMPATVTFDPSQGYLETWTATASAQDMLDSETATKVIDIPAVPKTKEPTIDVSFGEAGDNTVAYVTFKNNDEKPATIWYSTDGGENWNKYDPAVPVTFTATDENQEITVLAYAQAEGKLPSDEVDRTFELNNTATSVNELTNGKAVASVRYFNMAGQEMQEANGITIVVTTYTDGTTSAVKVIK